MKRFGLIGYPLTHSFSQRYFTEKFRLENRNDCSYQNFELQNISDLPLILAQFPDLAGLNVTIPHKERILGLLDSQTEVVKEIGACNCVRIQKNALDGYNTDVIGFEKSLNNFLQEPAVQALIVGTGGSARLESYVLRK